MNKLFHTISLFQTTSSMLAALFNLIPILGCFFLSASPRNYRLHLRENDPMWLEEVRYTLDVISLDVCFPDLSLMRFRVEPTLANSKTFARAGSLASISKNKIKLYI